MILTLLKKHQIIVENNVADKSHSTIKVCGFFIFMKPAFGISIWHLLRRTLSCTVCSLCSFFLSNNSNPIIKTSIYPTIKKMQINLVNIGKRYNQDWIFRQCSYQFVAGNAYAITGYNGSGKSTLLQTIAASTNTSEGSIKYSIQQQEITADNIYKYLTIAAPYIELVEEMTATEMLDFHQKFKPFFSDISIPEILRIVGLYKTANKEIRYFSSGMKQRLKLAQAIFSNVPILLLDEPCSNLDLAGYNLYHQLITTYCKQKLVIVCSNDVEEYKFCTEKISIENYKKTSK